MYFRSVFPSCHLLINVSCLELSFKKCKYFQLLSCFLVTHVGCQEVLKKTSSLENGSERRINMKRMKSRRMKKKRRERKMKKMLNSFPPVASRTSHHPIYLYIHCCLRLLLLYLFCPKCSVM